MRTYGQLHYLGDSGYFGLTNAPAHVVIMFKRMFPRVASRQSGVFTVSDSDAVCADLNWFMSRFPFECDQPCLTRLQAGERNHNDLRADIDAITLPDWKPSGESGFRAGFEPYPYQAQAAAVALRTGRLLLMDDVGLGKTVSALATLSSGAPLPAAIVVQPHLAEQWQAQFIDTFTHLSSHIIKGTKPYDLPQADIYIFKYSNIAGWEGVITQGLFKSAIFDEIQELRHGAQTRKGVAARHLVGMAELKMGLTATPIYNYGDEIYNIVQYLDGDVLGTSLEFQIEWCGYGKGVKNPKALGHYLRDSGLALRRTEEDVGDQMPPLNTVVQDVPWDSGLAADSLTLARELAGKVLEGRWAERGQAARELDLLLRQVTGVAKARYVAAYVDLLLKDAEKVLLAGWHRDVYDIWRTALQSHDPVLYTGSESAAQKRKNREAFINGTSRVMMISLRSGAGLDGLQSACQDVVFGELDWSPQVHKQVIGRLRRPGQTGQVTAHYLHTDNGSDPLIVEMLGLKASQAQGLVDPDKDLATVSSDESRIRRLAQAYLKQK